MDIQKVRTAFEFVRESWQKAQALHEKANVCRMSATGGAIRYDKDKIQTFPENYQEKWLIQAEDLDYQAKQVLQIAEKVREMTYSWMTAACRENEQFVLLQHYFLGKPYNTIKDEYIMLFEYGSKTTMYDVALRGMKRIAEKF